MSASAAGTLSSRTLISALTDPLALHGLRTHFGSVEPDVDRLRLLVVELIDPKLLRVALGPAVGPPWASNLQRVYDKMREAQPADFHDVDASWKRQRRYWQSILKSLRVGLQAVEEDAADASAASGAHGAVVERTVGRPERAADPGQSGARGDREAARPRRVRQLSTFGEAPDPDPDVESVAPPIEGVSGDAPEVEPADPGAVRSRRPDARGASAPAPPPSRSSGDAAPDFAPPGVAGGAGAPARAPVVRRPGAAAGGGPAGSSVRRPAAADPGSAVVQLIAAMLQSPQSLDRVRREWITSRASSTAWDRWSLPPAVAEVVRDRSR